LFSSAWPCTLPLEPAQPGRYNEDNTVPVWDAIPSFANALSDLFQPGVIPTSVPEPSLVALLRID
jgi:hypothetical protein